MYPKWSVTIFHKDNQIKPHFIFKKLFKKIPKTTQQTNSFIHPTRHHVIRIILRFHKQHYNQPLSQESLLNFPIWFTKHTDQQLKNVHS